MLKHGGAATSVILVGLLILQVACLSPVNAPSPLLPADPYQWRAIQNADRVKVWTLDDHEYLLANASVAEQGLVGEWDGEETGPIPFNAIAAIQIYEIKSSPLFWAVPLTVGVTALILAWFVAAGAASGW